MKIDESVETIKIVPDGVTEPEVKIQQQDEGKLPTNIQKTCKWPSDVASSSNGRGVQAYEFLGQAIDVAKMAKDMGVGAAKQAKDMGVGVGVADKRRNEVPLKRRNKRRSGRRKKQAEEIKQRKIREEEMRKQAEEMKQKKIREEKMKKQAEEMKQKKKEEQRRKQAEEMEQRKIRLDKEKKKMMEKDLAIKKEEEKLKIWQEKMKNSGACIIL
ncbi:golgin subfamily A member 6-like protein 7 [Brassica napus]|uniref:golgin subfamily A member 6-like protein 7 n=1 Tax=Brassica napus TaxID=3708 RepID=UPI002078AFD1|nr:golgin subfamily A member 6-like protein 7 [Brassica napus]